MLDDAAIMRLADSCGSLEMPPELPQTNHTERRGTTRYADHCAACHGPPAEGLDVLHAHNLVLLDGAYWRTVFGKARSGISMSDRSRVLGNRRVRVTA